MKSGSLVTYRGEGYVPMYREIHGEFLTPFYNDEVGIVVDFRYSHTDVPYLEILTPRGIKGWVRYEKVDVLR